MPESSGIDIGTMLWQQSRGLDLSPMYCMVQWSSSFVISDINPCPLFKYHPNKPNMSLARRWVERSHMKIASSLDISTTIK
jgi:hypothetical protein